MYHDDDEDVTGEAAVVDVRTKQSKFKQGAKAFGIVILLLGAAILIASIGTPPTPASNSTAAEMGAGMDRTGLGAPTGDGSVGQVDRDLTNAVGQSQLDLSKSKVAGQAQTGRGGGDGERLLTTDEQIAADIKRWKHQARFRSSAVLSADAVSHNQTPTGQPAGTRADPNDPDPGSGMMPMPTIPSPDEITASVLRAVGQAPGPPPPGATPGSLQAPPAPATTPPAAAATPTAVNGRFKARVPRRLHRVNAWRSPRSTRQRPAGIRSSPPCAGPPPRCPYDA